MHVESIEWFNGWYFQTNILMITYIFWVTNSRKSTQAVLNTKTLKIQKSRDKIWISAFVWSGPTPTPHPWSPHTPFSLSALVSSWFPLGSKSVLSLPPLHSHSGKTVGSSFSLWTKVWSLLLSSINLNHSHWPEKSPVLIGLVLA